MKNSGFILAVLAGSAAGLGLALALNPQRREKIISAIKESEELKKLKDLALAKFSALKEDIMPGRTPENMDHQVDSEKAGIPTA